MQRRRATDEQRHMRARLRSEQVAPALARRLEAPIVDGRQRGTRLDAARMRRQREVGAGNHQVEAVGAIGAFAAELDQPRTPVTLSTDPTRYWGRPPPGRDH